jgi:hypothetical protein
VLFAAHRHRVRWLVLAVFSILPVLYFFYWGSEIRFYSEYLPFLLPWLAAGSLTVMRERPRLGGAILAAAVAGSAVLMVPTRWASIPLDEPWVRSATPAAHLASPPLPRSSRCSATKASCWSVQEQGPLLDVLLDRLYLFNIEDSPARSSPCETWGTQRRAHGPLS